MSFIEFESANFTWPGASRPAVSNLDLRIEEGEYVAIVGRNGSGKSSLLRLMNGLRKADGGRVRVAGLDAGDSDNARALRSTLVLVFQSPPDQIVSTVVEEDVAFGPGNLRIERKEIHRRVDEALAIVGLEAERKSPPHFLSAGQQQRLAVAGALAMQPRAIAFDEATAMLDPPSRATMLDLMDRLNEAGVTIIHVTHDMAEAARSRRILLMEEGRLLRDAPPESFFEGGDGLLAEFGLPPSILLARRLGFSPRVCESALECASRLGKLLPKTPAFVAREAGKLEAGKLEAGVGPDQEPGPEAKTLAFSLERVAYSYLRGTVNERKALADISLVLPKGCVLALVGHTGSGKSTILQLLNSLAAPTSGRVLSFGDDPSAPKADLRAMRMRSPLAVQRPESAIFETYAADDVAFGPKNQGLSGRALVDRVRRAMDRVGLPYEGFRDRQARALSGGERRRLALAGVIALEPEALLLDEPTQALDPAGKAAIMELVLSFARGGTTIVFSTHSMEEAARADLVAVLKGGCLLAFGRPAEIFGINYDEAWGIGRPWAAEVAGRLAEMGLDLGVPPLDIEALASAIAKAMEGPSR
ncbi:MAG TPA: energy-coupling factor transporter ATPase [Rectinemataceae bacterium]|nr:energy-coupling factor transporter ATPase [Rectinemataceae bacterium]